MNGLIRYAIRRFIMEGVTRGVDAWSRRQAESAPPEAQHDARKNRKRTRQTLRMFRRMFRF